MNLTDPVTSIPGVGGIIESKLAKLGIQSVFDLVYYLPSRYEDRSLISTIDRVQPGEEVTINATVDSIKNTFTQKGKAMQVAQVHDASKNLQVVWFNQVYLTKVLKIGQQYSFFGAVDWFGKKLSLVSPEHEPLDQLSPLHTGRIVPIYHETAGVSSKWLRNKIYWLLANFEAAEHLADKNILQAVHFPDKIEAVTPAKKRLAFDELFLLHLKSLVHKQRWSEVKLAHPLQERPIQKFIDSWGFSATASQAQAIAEILHDLSQPKAMNRLLEGDVGSGKTVVAATAVYMTYLNHFKSLVMAPTQILANQHYETLTHLLNPFGLNVGLATGSSKKFDQLSDVVVGTQALLSQKFNLGSVALIVIDEQHKFGVAQRGLIGEKGIAPHILTMTATPIPRTVALAMYGELDLSTLTDLPTGRLPVKTWVVTENKRQSAYEWIRKQISTDVILNGVKDPELDSSASPQNDSHKTQVFVVCPIIEESESMQTVKAVKIEFENLQKIFPELKLGLLHGKLKAKEKDAVLADFRDRKVDILVTTPVVEVGIDIPNASIMVIEAAERFGLAQLHQLRGRVGRGNQQAYCLLFSDVDSQRLKAMETHHSGLELAEIDMSLRGPGDIFGVSQHGLPSFKIATYSDLDLMQSAKEAAQEVLPQLPNLPHLRSIVEKDKISLVQPN